MSSPNVPKKPVYVTPSDTIALLEKHGIRLRKRLGQHFLVDNNIILNILDAAQLEPGDVVLEVGPGIGALTKGLADTAGWVVAVEVDRRMAAVFRENVTATNVRLIETDALRLSRQSLAEAAMPRGWVKERPAGTLPNKLVANLPYNIAAPLVVRLLEVFPEIALMVIMLQKEIADRMAAKPGQGNYGALTAKLSYYGKVRRLFSVPATVFVPPPRVESAVVRFERQRSATADRERVFAVIDAAFSQRRKKLVNALAGTLDGGLSKERVGKAMADAGIGSDVRAQELSIGEFERIASQLPASGR